MTKPELPLSLENMLAALSANGRVCITAARSAARGEKSGTLVEFCYGQGQEIRAWSPDFGTSVFKAYQRAIDRGVLT